MTKDEIYEHLAKVYLGKKRKKKKAPSIKFYGLLFLNVFVVAGIGVLIFFGQFEPRAKEKLDRNNLSFTVNQYPLRLQYNFKAPYPQIENFTLSLPNVDIRQYSVMAFSIRSGRDTAPSILKITLENKKKEMSSYFLKGISKKWQRKSIPLSDFQEITDWSNITKVRFIFEAWNTGEQKGSVLIEDICFSN